MLCYVKTFDNFEKAKGFIQQIGKQQQPILFKYVESINNNIITIQKKQIDGNNQFNLIFRLKEQNDYQIYQMTQMPYEQIKTQNKKFWLEKQIIIQPTSKAIQIWLSCLYEIIENDFDKTIKNITQKSYPSKIYLYICSEKENSIKNFIRLIGDDKENFLVQNFLQEIGNQILHLNIKDIKNFNSLTSQVLGLTKDIFIKTIMPSLENFKYTIKIDGMRSLLIIDENTKSIYKIQASTQDIFQIKHTYTVLDCEEYNKIFYVFDALVIKGNDIMEKSYTERLNLLKEYKLPNNCIMKEFFEIKNIKNLLIAFQDQYDGIDIDGIILNEMSRSYFKTEAYKLKDKKHLTNDFLLKLIEPTNISNEEKKLLNFKKGDIVYKLYCGGKPQDFAFINNENCVSNQFQEMAFALPYFGVQPTEYMIINESFLDYIEKTYEGEKKEEIKQTLQQALKKKFNDMIVECAYNDNLQAYPYRLRQDKTDTYKRTKTIFGNYYITALSNFNNIMDPITKEYLEKPDQAYFNIENPDKQYDYFKTFGQNVRRTGFNTSLNLLKEMLGQSSQSQYLNALDYGAGRNADYYLFLRHGFNTVIAYEPDRKSNIIYYDRIRQQIGTQQKKKIPLTYIVLDGFAENPVVRQLNINKINFFQSNYVIHYLCESINKIKILKQMILDYSYNNAIFYFSDNDYYPLLAKNGGEYDNGKYHVKILDTELSLKAFGQKIEVYMPWISKEMTYEYIVNIDAIQKVFGSDITLIQKIHHIDLVNDVPEEDRDYIGCMYTYIFRIQKK